MAVLLVQPLLALGVLPGLKMPASRRCHRWFGFGLLAAVGVHVGGLWLTSPPDVLDALLLRSPTPFSVYGVAAMWMLFLTAGIALYRKRLRPLTWRRVHLSLAAFIALSTILHVLLIEGTMGTASKVILSGLVVLAIAVAIRRSRLKG